MENKKWILVLFVFIILSISAFASVNYLHNSIKSNYSSGETISGNVNLRFVNQPGDVLVKSNFPGELTLLELIENQTNIFEGVHYNCSTNDCLNDYISSGVVSQIQLSSGEISYAGFEIDGSGIEIKDANLRISSNAPASCSPNLYVDLLGDNEHVLTSSLGNQESCGVRHTGCYDQSNTGVATIVTGKEYCERISIPQGPAIIVGAEIKMGTGESNLTMKLYDFESPSLLGSCKLPQNTQNTEELSCIVNYSSYDVEDYYVCVTTSSNNGYQIGQETSSPTCGTAQGFNSLNSDFDLFAETVKYAASPIIELNRTNYKKAFNLNLTVVLDNYIQNLYGGDCDESNCYIPLKIFGPNQIVLFDDVELRHESFGASIANINEINELSFDASKITSGNLSLDISKANFEIPLDTNQNKFRFYIDNDLLFEKSISIARSFSFEVNPRSVAFGQNARFTASSSSANILRTIWNFGDGTSIQSINGTSVYHAFTRNNSYFDINVTAINNQTQSTRQFRIFVGNPKDIVNLTIIDYRKRLTNITNQINSYPSWAIQKIQDIVKVSNLTSEINSIESDYKNATTEQEYQQIMLDLIALNVPSYVLPIDSGENLPLSIGYENVNVDYIEQIENKNLDNSALRNQIIAWMNDNFNAQISFKEIRRVGDGESEAVGTLFTIKTNPLSSFDSEVYLIFGHDIENSGLYKTSYGQRSITSGIDYVLLDSSSQIFEFFVEGEIDAETLGAYISPSLELLGDIQAPTGECNLNNICEDDEDANSCPEDCSKSWIKFTLIGWIILGFVALIAYILMQEWYKRNYQKKLFPDSNELYNLINFIYNARKSGLSDFEIKSKLRQQTWSSERIRFALRKIDGKRVGMFEIPLFTRKEHNETVRQIANRQPQGVINARFIKRPYYQ